MSHEPFAPDEGIDALAASLGALAPARSRMDRDCVMFRAGQAAAARPPAFGRRAWMTISAGLGLIALSEAAVLAHRPPSRVVERVVVVRVPAPTPSPPAPEGPAVPAPPSPAEAPGPVQLALGRTDYERLAGQVLRYGLDGLPASPTARPVRPEPRSAPARQLLQEELHKVLDPGDPS